MSRSRIFRYCRRVAIAFIAVFIVWIIYQYSASDNHASKRSSLADVDKIRLGDTTAMSKVNTTHASLSTTTSTSSKPSIEMTKSTTSPLHHLTDHGSTTVAPKSTPTPTVSKAKPTTPSQLLKTVQPSSRSKAITSKVRSKRPISHRHPSRSSSQSNRNKANIKHKTYRDRLTTSAIQARSSKKYKLKTILAWTTWFHSDWPFKYGPWKCGQFTCNITNDKNRINDSDALLFHGADSIMNKTSTFRYRDVVPAKQLWVYHSVENPAVTKEFNVRTGVFPFHNNLFNLMMTYAKDADIRLCYGRYVKGDFHQYYDPNINYAKGKNKLIAWVASTCYSGRQAFAEQLAQYLPIDMYGKCGNLTCTRSGACRHKLTKEYKFYLSLENFICRDYLSEKFFIHSLARSLVPIVVTGCSLQDETIAPPGSYINVRDFKTVQQLADYIKLVAANDALYNKYFQWKAYYRYERESCGLDYGVCQLCKNLQNKKWVSRKSKTIPDLTHRWGFNKANCVDYSDIFVKNEATGQIDIKPHQFN